MNPAALGHEPGGSDLTGAQVGRYEIRARLGAGGMGEVYRAMDTKLHRQVALKRVGSRYRNEPEYRQHLLNEARRASALNDSRVAVVYDVLEHEQELFVVMEFVDGFTLRERMMDGAIGIAEFLRIATQCAQGLMAAHEKGIVHGDLKPENVMVSRGTGEIKLCDFGLARRISLPDGPETQTTMETVASGAIAGTPAYMPPELHAGGSLTPRADIFSLGVTFYEMLSGTHPFRARNIASTAQRIVSEVPAPLGGDVPAVLAAIVFRMMEKDPSRRYENARRLFVALQAASANVAGHGRRWKRVVVSTAVLSSLAAALIAFLLSNAPVAPQRPPAKNLVVLPFVTVGSEVQRFKSDGLSETLNAALVKLSVGHDLQVLPASDVQTRRVKTVNDAQEELGATLVLKGSVQYSDRLARVTILLFDGITGKQLRADTATVDATDTFMLQDSIVAKAANLLGIQLHNPAQSSIQYGTLQPGAYEYYLRGRGYLLNFDRVENLDSAIEVFRSALRADPSYSLAYAGLGEALWRKFEFSKDTALVEPARMACESAVSLGPDFAESHLCLGTVYIGTGQYEKAIAAFNRGIELEPTMDVAYLNLGIAYEKLGRAADAEKTYFRAIQMKPQYWAAYSALGNYYYGKARYDEALKMFSRVVSLAPDSYRGFSNLGAMYVFLGRKPEAIAAFEKALSIRPFYPAASNLGALHFYEGDYAAAARAFRQAVRIDEHDYLIWGNLGASLRWAGQGEEARSAYEEARQRAQQRLKVNPRNALALMNLAEYNGALGDGAAALSFLLRALALSPDDPQLLFKAALIYDHNLKRREDALLYLKKAIEKGQSWEEVDRSPSLAELRKDPRFNQLRSSR